MIKYLNKKNKKKQRIKNKVVITQVQVKVKWHKIYQLLKALYIHNKYFKKNMAKSQVVQQTKSYKQIKMITNKLNKTKNKKQERKKRKRRKRI